MDNEKKTVVEEIVEPMEIIWKMLLDLTKDERIPSDEADAPSVRLFAIVQEMDANLSFLRRNIEGILEPHTPPDDIYGDYESEERLGQPKCGLEYDDVPASNWEPSILDLFNSRGEEK